MSIDLSETDRAHLAESLMKEDEEITAELLESALESLRRRKAEARLRELKEQIADAERKNEQARMMKLIQEKLLLDRQLRFGGGNADTATP